MTRLGTAQVIHSLAAATDDDLFDDDAWPGIARLLLARDCGWPAVLDLAAMTTTTQPAISDAVARLAEQTGRELAGTPAPGFWEIVCGLVARSWRLGLCDPVDAMYRMDSLWWLIRDRDRSSSRGLQIIWEGMGLKEIVGFQDISGEAAALLDEADRFVPADAVDGPLCTAVLDAIW